MANVFISHSSADKPLVRRLATSLLAEGVPVWLDAWELALGDSLLDKIYEGIDQSGALLLAMSKSSSASGWVNKELNAALMKEQQVGRKFVIPVRLDDCPLPLKVADRLYADFSAGFSAPLTGLVRELSKLGLLTEPVQPARELLPLSFTREVHLDKNSLLKSVDAIRRRQGTLALASSQVVVNDDAAYIELWQRLHARIDDVGNSRWFTPDLEAYLRSASQQVQNLERYLREGVALLVNHEADSEAIYWFAHLLRSQAVRSLWGSQPPDESALTYGEQAPEADISNNHSAMKYLGCDNLDSAVIWANEDEVYGPNAHSFYVPASQVKDLRTDQGAYAGAVRALDALAYPAFSRYMYPQVLFRAVRDQKTAIPWSLSDAWVGLE